MWPNTKDFPNGEVLKELQPLLIRQVDKAPHGRITSQDSTERRGSDRCSVNEKSRAT